MERGGDTGGARREEVGADLILPMLGVAFAAYFFSSVWDLTWEAKANAIIIGVILLGLIAVLFVRVAVQVVRGEAGLGFATLMEPRWAHGPRLAIVGLTAAFIFVLPWLGLTLGLFLLTVLLMRILRAGTWRATLTTSAIVAVIAYLLFIALLNSRLPRGPVEKLFAAVFGF